MVQQESAATNPKTKRVRSPAYPGIPLEEALNKAAIIRKAEGKNEANVETILAHWSYKPMSGAGLVALSALIKFGLMTDNGSGKNRKVRLTDLALKILLDDRPESAERLALVREAALAPTIHKELWDKYQGTLPSDLNLRFYLRTEKGFSDNAADDLIRDFRKTLDYTKLEKSANISPDGNELIKPEGEIKMPTATVERTQTTEHRGEPQKQPLQTTTKQVPIPLTGVPWGVLQLPFPMTEENWKELEDFLALMKGPITAGTRRQAVTEE